MSAPGLAAAAWPKNPFRLLAWLPAVRHCSAGMAISR